MYIDKLADIVNEYNNTYQGTIKMKPVDVKSSTYIDFDNVKNNDKDPKSEAGDHVRISKYKKLFAKSYAANYSEEAFVVKKTVAWTYYIEETVGTFHEKELQKSNQTTLGKKIEKRNIRRKGDKLYFKGKSFDNSFNSWIGKKDIVI